MTKASKDNLESRTWVIRTLSFKWWEIRNPNSKGFKDSPSQERTKIQPFQTEMSDLHLEYQKKTYKWVRVNYRD